MVKPLRKVVKVKKHKATFRRHQSDTNVSVPVRCVAVGFPCKCPWRIAAQRPSTVFPSARWDICSVPPPPPPPA